MKLILQTDVKNLGKTGDQVSVKKGFARNYLIPKGYAVLMNKNRLKVWEHQKVIIEAKKRKAVSERKALIERLSSIKLKFEKEAQKDNRLFGSVTAHEISQALEKLHKLSVDKRDIHFSELKTVGEHSVSIKLDSENQTEIKLSIKGKIRKAEYEAKTSDSKSPSQIDSLSDVGAGAIKETADTETEADSAKSLKTEEAESELSNHASLKAKSSENEKTTEKLESKKKIEKDTAKILETTEEKNLSDSATTQKEEPVAKSSKKETKKSLKGESFKSAKPESKDKSESKAKTEKAEESSKKLEGNLKTGQSKKEPAEKATAPKSEVSAQAQSGLRDKTEKANSFDSKEEEKKTEPAREEKSQEESKEKSKSKKSYGFFKNLFRKK